MNFKAASESIRHLGVVNIAARGSYVAGSWFFAFLFRGMVNQHEVEEN